MFSFELETREGWIVQRVHLQTWAVAGHKLGAIETIIFIEKAFDKLLK